MKPQYRRLQVGILVGEKSVIHGRIVGELSKVPYAEPTWLADGYYSPYYTEVACFLYPSLAPLNAVIKNHRNFQKAVRKFFDEVVLSDALVCGVCMLLALPEIKSYVFPGTRGRWQTSQQGSYRGNGVSLV